MKFRMDLTLPFEALTAGFHQAQGGELHPERVIDSTEIIFVTSGVLGMREERREFLVRPGQTLILHPGRVHAGTLPHGSDLTGYWIHFRLNREGQRAARRPLFDVPQHGDVREPERMTELFRRYLEDQASGKQDRIQACLLILMMLAEIQRKPPEEGRVATLAARAQRYIYEFFYQPIQTHTIARELKCNPDYLGRIYHASYGHSVTEGIHLRRIQVAKEAMIYHTGNINDIAEACGYASAIYFRRMFMRYAGMTPGAYRRLYARGFA